MKPRNKNWRSLLCSQSACSKSSRALGGLLVGAARNRMRNFRKANLVTNLLSLLFVSIIGIGDANDCFAVASAAISSPQQAEPNKNEPATTAPVDKGIPPAGAKSSDGGTKDKPSEPPKSERQVVEERKAKEAAKKRGELTFDDLKFPMEKGEEFKDEMLTKENKELDKKTWKIRGFILPTTLFSQTNIKEFVLVRDNQECCFGPGAALYDCIIVKMAPGKSINYSTRVVAVKGKLEIDTESFQYPDGGHFAVYKMTAEEVK